MFLFGDVMALDEHAGYGAIGPNSGWNTMPTQHSLMGPLGVR